MTNKARRPENTLFSIAVAALKNAYAPYVGPPCGAAIKMADGAMYAGASFENAGFVHGIEALEAALGQALINRPPGSFPLVTEVVLCFEDKQDDFPYIPGAAALLWLKALADRNLTITYMTASGTVFAQETYKERLMSLPALAGNKDEFSDYARVRKQNTKRHPVFSEAPLSRLFDVRLCAQDIWSHYAVGAMVESEKGELYYGCNAEPAGNKAFHAEAMALAAMVTAEGGKARVRRVTILTAGSPGVPCGGCRQNINELATEETEIVGMNLEGETIRHRHCDLLPHDFGPEALAGGSDRS